MPPKNENYDWQGRKIVELELRIKHLEMKETDQEDRLRKVEKAIYLGTGAILILQVVLKFLPLKFTP